MIPKLGGQVKKLDDFPYVGTDGSDIYRGELTLSCGESILVAIKASRCTERFTQQCQLDLLLLREASIWNRLRHPNVTLLLGISYDVGGLEVPHLISCFYSRGNIAHYLRENPSVDKLQLVTQVAAALCYLHDQHIIHGDVRAANVVINDFGEALLLDFGLSQDLKNTKYAALNRVGASRWMSPEIINEGSEEGGDGGMEGEDTTLSQWIYFAGDVWAYGMTILEIFTGRRPFHSIPCNEVAILAILQGVRPRPCPIAIRPEICTALGRCWKTLPVERPSAYALSSLLNVISALRRQKRAPLSCQQANVVLDRVDKQVDDNGDNDRGSGRGSNRNSIHGRCPDTEPYPCYWPRCGAKFDKLVECQSHQVDHVPSW